MSSQTEQKMSNSLFISLKDYLGSLRRRFRNNSRQTQIQLHQYLNDPALTNEQLKLLQNVNTGIHHNDEMYNGSGAHYFMAGLSAVSCIDAVLAQTKEITIENVLDMPCGHGRELRTLKARFPKAVITACDIQTEAVDFCAKTFDAVPFYSHPELNALNFADKFDLIWCGSLITHLNRLAIMELLNLFARSLQKNGVLIFTTHGDFAVADMIKGSSIYMISAEDLPVMKEDYQKKGFAYHDYTHDSSYFDFYPNECGYGVSLTSPEWIREQIKNIPDLQEIYFQERGWCSHQDVFGFVKQN